MKIAYLILPLIIITTNAYLQYCPNSYFFDTQHCQTCQLNCLCTSQNTCNSCVDGYTFYQGQCIQCPQASGSIYGQCSGCCSRTNGTILSCTDCTTVPGKYSFLFSGRCILSDGCFEVDLNGFCTQCRSGYYQTNNICNSCDPSCATCTDSSNCLTCAEGYYWMVNNGGLCTTCPNGCSTCDTNGTCFSCLNSYYQFNNHCLQCPANCLTCADGSTCTSCSVGILVSNLCIQCTDTTYGGSAGCLSCTNYNNFIKCTLCDDTYYLDSSTGVCTLCSSSIVGAIRCRDQNTPTQCSNDYSPTLSSRYYLVGISCVLNSNNCKKISDVLGNCGTCYPGYTMSASNACVQCPFTGCTPANSSVVSNVCTCTLCSSGYYLGAGAVVCSSCPLHCSVCPAGTCSQCMSGYYLSGGSCLPASVSNCLVYASSSTCTTCNQQYYLGSDNLCYKCQVNCQICTNRFTCTSCQVGFYMHPSHYCVTLPSYCLNFDISLLQCTLCSYGYYLSNGFCIQCSVQKGTLSNCQGLCPIDYYLQTLLIVNSNFSPLIIFQFTAILLMGISLF